MNKSGLTTFWRIIAPPTIITKFIQKRSKHIFSILSKECSLTGSSIVFLKFTFPPDLLPNQGFVLPGLPPEQHFVACRVVGNASKYPMEELTLSPMETTEGPRREVQTRQASKGLFGFIGGVDLPVEATEGLRSKAHLCDSH
eukprot:4694636-Amphidinium_carterae.1